MRFTPRLFTASLLVTVGTAYAANLRYTSWAAHNPGTTVVMKCVNESARGRNTLELVYVLKQVTPEKVIVETTMYAITPEGKKMLNVGSDEILSATTVPADDDPSHEERLTIAGKEYRTKVVTHSSEMNGEKTISRIWTTPEVPGMNVKLEITSETGTTRRTSYFEVIAITLK